MASVHILQTLPLRDLQRRRYCKCAYNNKPNNLDQTNHWWSKKKRNAFATTNTETIKILKDYKFIKIKGSTKETQSTDFITEFQKVYKEEIIENKRGGREEIIFQPIL